MRYEEWDFPERPARKFQARNLEGRIRRERVVLVEPKTGWNHPKVARAASLWLRFTVAIWIGFLAVMLWLTFFACLWLLFTLAKG